jgi:hypothetical protein
MRERATEIVLVSVPVLIEVAAVVLMMGIAVVWLALRAHGA